MKRTKLLSCAASAFAATALCMVTAPALATPASGFTAVQTIKGVYPPLQVKGDKADKWDVKIDTKDESDVYVVRNSIASGGQSGWHSHPGPSLITVTIGETPPTTVTIRYANRKSTEPAKDSWTAATRRIC